MTVGPLQGVETFAIRTPLDVLSVRMTFVTLQRHVPGRVAVHAAWMYEDRIRRQEGRPGFCGVALAEFARCRAGCWFGAARWQTEREHGGQRQNTRTINDLPASGFGNVYHNNCWAAPVMLSNPPGESAIAGCVC